jgi:signal transduction histidine kinase
MGVASGRSSNGGRLVIAFAALAIAALGVGAYVLANSQSDQRKTLRDRYAERTQVASSLLDSLFVIAFAPQAAQLSQQFKDGGSRQALDRQAKSSNLAYSLIVDPTGKVVASSSGAPANAMARLSARPFHLKMALAKGYGLSDRLPAQGRTPAAVESAIAFKSARGPLVSIQGSPLATFSSFLSGTLRPLPTSRGEAYVLDGAGKPLGRVARSGKSTGNDTALVDSVGKERQGLYDRNGTERFFAASPVGNTQWKVALAADTSALYAPVAGTARWVPWLLLALLTVALLSVAGLLRRDLSSGAALARANLELERNRVQLERRAVELERSNTDLEQFAYVASHDLSEPLRTVAGLSDLMSARYRGQLDPEADEFLEHMGNSVERMQAMIDGLLAYSRVGRGTIVREDVDLDAVVDEAVEALGSIVGRSGANITRDDLPTVRGDRVQLGQLVQNLIANALKFTAPGVTPEVHISCERGRDVWTIRVQDNGIGVDPKYAELIFKMFQRLEPRERYEGTGIGLPLAQRIVERHGGRLWVEPAPGGGSIFSFTMPLRASVTDESPDAGPERVGAV